MRSINTSKLSVKTHTKDFSSHDILLHPSLLPQSLVSGPNATQLSMNQSNGKYTNQNDHQREHKDQREQQGYKEQGHKDQQGQKMSQDQQSSSPSQPIQGSQQQLVEKYPDSDSNIIVEIKQNLNVVYIRLKQTEAVRGVQHISILNDCFLQTGLQQMKPCQMRYVRMEHAALDYIRISFKDQFLSRSDMWPFTRHLLNESVYIGKRLEYRGMRCTVKQLMKNQKHVKSGVITANTRITFRTQSGVTYLLIEISKEMWEYATDGDTFWEKAINGFCRDLFTKWNANRASHSLQIVFYGRYRVQSQCKQNDLLMKTLDEQLGPNCCFTLHKNVKCVDFFKHMDGSITSYNNTNSLLASIKKSFLEYHTSIQCIANSTSEKLGTRVEFSVVQSSDSNFLEAMNLVLAAYQSHHVNRDLHHTGQYFIVLSAGVGVYNIHNSSLSSLSKKRIGDNGIGVDMICFSYPPLHHIPLFKYAQKKSHSESVYKSPDWLSVYFYDQKTYTEDAQKNETGKRTSTEHGDPIKSLGSSNQNSGESIDEDGIVFSTAPEYFQLPSADKFIATCRMPSLKDRQISSRSRIPLPKFKRNTTKGNTSRISFEEHDDKVFDLTQNIIQPITANNVFERDGIKSSRTTNSASYNKKSITYYDYRDKNERLEKYDRRLKRSNTISQGGNLSGNEIDSSTSVNQFHLEETSKILNISSSHDSKRINPSPTHSKIRSLNSHGSYNDPSHLSNASPVRRFMLKSFNPFQNTIQNPMTVHLEAPKRPSLHQKRWAHLFPSDNSRQKTNDATALLPNWLSLVEPACLPITTYFWPDNATLSTYNQNNSQFSADEHYNTMSLMQELICQRLHQGYQIYHPTSDLISNPKHYYLSLSDQFQEVYIDEYNPDVVTVKRYVKISRTNVDRYGTLQRSFEVDGEDYLSMQSLSDSESERDEVFIYKFFMWNQLESTFLSRDIEFKNNPPDEYKWNQLDNIVLGYIDDLPLKLAPRCIQFHLVPSGELQIPSGARVTSPIGKNPLLHQLSLFLPMLTTRVFVPCSGESALNIQLIDVEDISCETQLQKRKISTTRIKLENKGERYEWIYLTAKDSYYPGECFFFHIDWLVCSAVTIETYIQALQRKAKQCGFDMYLSPIDSSWKSYSTPFRSYAKIDLPKNEENKLKLLQILCQQFHFYSELLPISINSKRFINQIGTVVVHTDMRSLWWLENRSSPNYIPETAKVLKKEYEEFKSICNTLVFEEAACQSSISPSFPFESVPELISGASEEEKLKLLNILRTLDGQEKFLAWLKRFVLYYESWTKGHKQLKDSNTFSIGRDYKKVLLSFEKLLDLLRQLHLEFGIEAVSFIQCNDYILGETSWSRTLIALTFMIIDIRKWERNRDRSKKILETIQSVRKEREIKKKTAKRKAIELQSQTIKANESDFRRISSDFDKLLHDLKYLQVDIEMKLIELQNLRQFDLLVEAHKTVMNNIDVSRDPLQELKRTLIEWNMWIKRDYRAYPKGESICDSMIQTQNPAGSKVYLYKIMLKDSSSWIYAWEQLHRIVWMRNRFFVLHVNGVFTQKLSNEYFLILEQNCHDSDKLLQWVYCDDNKKVNDELRQNRTKRDDASLLQTYLYIVDGIAEMHSAGLEHNRLQSDIIYVNQTGEVKFIDLGVKYMNNTPSCSDTPEEKFSERSYKFGAGDVYSLGIILIEIFSGISPDEIYKSLRMVQLSKFVPNFSDNRIKSLVLRMLDPKPDCRPSVHEVARLLRQQCNTQSHLLSDSSMKMYVNPPEFASGLRATIQSATLQQLSNSTLKTSISKNSLLDGMSAIFTGLRSELDLFQNIQTDPHVQTLQELCEMYCADVFSENGKLFELEDGQFTAVDSHELEREMIGFGRFLYFCCIRGIQMNLRFHPLVYCSLVDEIPSSDIEILKMIHICGRTLYTDDVPLSHALALNFTINASCNLPFLNILLQESKEIIQKEKKRILGTKFRIRNLQHLRRGFIEFLGESERKFLTSMSWIDAEILCLGPRTITVQSILNFLGKSLSDKSWEESEEASRTRTWLIEWIQIQGSENLQLVLKLITGAITVPTNTLNYTLEIFPILSRSHQLTENAPPNSKLAINSDILIVRSTSFNRLYLGTSCQMRLQFFDMMNRTIRSQSNLDLPSKLS